MKEIKGSARIKFIRKNLTGDQPKLYEPWLAMDGVEEGAVTE